MLIFRFKKQLYLFQIVLFTFLGLFFITNNPQVMATCNNNSEGKLKKNIDIIEEAVDTLEENIKFFNKKGIQINLNKLTKLFYNDKKRNTSTQNISSTSKPNKKKK